MSFQRLITAGHILISGNHLKLFILFLPVKSCFFIDSVFITFMSSSYRCYGRWVLGTTTKRGLNNSVLLWQSVMLSPSCVMSIGFVSDSFVKIMNKQSSWDILFHSHKHTNETAITLRKMEVGAVFPAQNTAKFKLIFFPE